MTELTVEQRNALLDIKIDATITVREALATQLIGWALNKINNLNTYDAEVQSITNLAVMHPGRIMSDDTKIEILQKLQRLGVEL